MNFLSGTVQLIATLSFLALTAPSWIALGLNRSQKRGAVVLFAEVGHPRHLNQHCHHHCHHPPDLHPHDAHDVPYDHHRPKKNSPQSLTSALVATVATRMPPAGTESSTTLVIATKAFR